jgi:hypothetical protein
VRARSNGWPVVVVMGQRLLEVLDELAGPASSPRQRAAAASAHRRCVASACG